MQEQPFGDCVSLDVLLDLVLNPSTIFSILSYLLNTNILRTFVVPRLSTVDPPVSSNPIILGLMGPRNYCSRSLPTWA